MRNSVSPTRRDVALVAMVALAVCAIGITNDFVYDDTPLIVENARAHGVSHWWEILTNPYWPPPFVENLYRPLAMLLLALEYTIGGGAPLVFRVVSYLLYAASAVAVLVVASRLMPRPASLAAGLLFAVHPVHVEAVAVAVNQGELAVALIALAMLARFLDRRNGDGLSPRDWATFVALYAAAILMKESGYMLPALLLAAEATLVTPRAWKDRAKQLGPGFAALAATAIVILLARRVVLGGRVAGATPYVDLQGLGPAGRMVSMLQVVPEWARLLLWPQRLAVDFDPGTFAHPEQLGGVEYLGIALLVGAALTVWSTRRRLPAVAFGLTACAIALLPVSNLVPTGVMLAERTLFLPSAMFVLAVAAAGEALAQARPPFTRRVVVAGCALLLAMGAVRSVSRHRVWNSQHLQIAPRPVLRQT